MSFVTWLAMPVAITLIASLIMTLVSHPPRTNTHQDIESFARFRGALARQLVAPLPSPDDAEEDSPATRETSSTTAVEDRQSPMRTGIAATPNR
jgi:hypothetical protein